MWLNKIGVRGMNKKICTSTLIKENVVNLKGKVNECLKILFLKKFSIRKEKKKQLIYFDSF